MQGCEILQCMTITREAWGFTTALHISLLVLRLARPTTLVCFESRRSVIDHMSPHKIHPAEVKWSSKEHVLLSA